MFQVFGLLIIALGIFTLGAWFDSLMQGRGY